MAGHEGDYATAYSMSVWFQGQQGHVKRHITTGQDVSRHATLLGEAHFPRRAHITSDHRVAGSSPVGPIGFSMPPVRLSGGYATPKIVAAVNKGGQSAC